MSDIKEQIDGNLILRGDFPTLKNRETAQKRGEPKPSSILKIRDNARIINLPEPDKSILKDNDFFDLVITRESRRIFNDSSLTLDELSLLLYLTNGIRKEGNFRTVPSGGRCHPLETYIAVNNVDGLEAGIYHYLPQNHSLDFLYTPENQREKLKDGGLGKPFASDCALSFLWTAIPDRTRWRYGPESTKLILQDTGHICQNLYLACEALGCGTCAISAYDQEEMDSLLQLDGQNEFTIYLAPVGKVN